MTICTKLEEEHGLALPINIIKWVTIVAWLYNVADHKYDKDGKIKKYVRYFLHDCAPDHSADLMTCIFFSREKKEGKEYCLQFLAPEFQLVRNIVSDADKLTVAYTKQENKTPVSEEQIFLNIIVDCNEKLSK
jgi:hypothetical protein